jgi:hypothetical protein
MQRGRGVASFLLLSLLPAPAVAAVPNVTTTGIDSATCAQAAPCASVQHAVLMASSADTIRITVAATIGLEVRNGYGGTANTGGHN